MVLIFIPINNEVKNVNTIGTANVLESLRILNHDCVAIIITSDKCYENKEIDKAYKETDRMGGYDPYSSSKGCSELLTNSFRQSFYKEAKIALASVRSGNVIGGGDWSKERLIPDIIRAFEKKKVVSIRYPNSVRPWQHVLEPLTGYLLLAEQLYKDGKNYAGAWNFGPNETDAQEVRWIADRLTKLWGNGASWEIDKNKQPHEAKLLKLDCNKAKDYLGWVPRLPLSEALIMLVNWYQASSAKEDMQEFTLKQIKEYTS